MNDQGTLSEESVRNLGPDSDFFMLHDSDDGCVQIFRDRAEAESYMESFDIEVWRAYDAAGFRRMLSLEPDSNRVLIGERFVGKSEIEPLIALLRAELGHGEPYELAADPRDVDATYRECAALVETRNEVADRRAVRNLYLIAGGVILIVAVSVVFAWKMGWILKFFQWRRGG